MKRILVIEDEPEMRRNIATLLRFQHYEPIAAENGRVGVEAARRESPDLILCDVMMPELDGYGVLQELQTDATLTRIPFIFLTAKGERDDLRSGMNLGADDYLTKPVANADLVRAIETRLRRSKQQAKREFKPDFSSFEPLLQLGLTPRAAEALLWLAQGKTNADIAVILGITESTVKKHVQEIFDKLGVETRGAATVRALEVLNPQADCWGTLTTDQTVSGPAPDGCATSKLRANQATAA
jgi:DNA-binding NarL/FixJ family response regulator